MSPRDLAALDALCCTLDEARPLRAVTAASWGAQMNFDRHGVAASSVASLKRASLAAASPLTPAANHKAPRPVVTPAAVHTQQPAISFPRDVCLPARGERSAPADTITRPVALCVFCAMERALSGHGPAPRINGDVWLHPCPRHEEASSQEAKQLPTARRAEAPACDRAPGSPAVNLNAGIVPAFPKGRWSVL
jgi:hypothetical protein